jgi:hypothetical protein
MQRIFRLSKNQQTEDDKNKLNIGSCSAHTMHRLSRQLRKHVNFLFKKSNKYAKTLAFCSFSLLLNAKGKLYLNDNF